MITRRDYLKLSLALGAALSARPSLLWADDAPLPLITRPIPSTGEAVPAIGLGSSATFAPRIADNGPACRRRASHTSLRLRACVSWA